MAAATPLIKITWSPGYSPAKWHGHEQTQNYASHTERERATHICTSATFRNFSPEELRLRDCWELPYGWPPNARPPKTVHY